VSAGTAAGHWCWRGSVEKCRIGFWVRHLVRFPALRDNPRVPRVLVGEAKARSVQAPAELHRLYFLTSALRTPQDLGRQCDELHNQLPGGQHWRGSTQRTRE
jgi:hypothetical protein